MKKIQKRHRSRPNQKFAQKRRKPKRYPETRAPSPPPAPRKEPARGVLASGTSQMAAMIAMYAPMAVAATKRKREPRLHWIGPDKVTLCGRLAQDVKSTPSPAEVTCISCRRKLDAS